MDGFRDEQAYQATNSQVRPCRLQSMKWGMGYLRLAQQSIADRLLLLTPTAAASQGVKHIRECPCSSYPTSQPMSIRQS